MYERQIARDVSVYHYGQEIAGEFFVQVTANAGQSLEEIEALVRDELESIRQSGPTEHEIQRAKNRIESQHVRQLERVGGFGGRADQLNYYNTYTGDPSGVNTDLDRYLAVKTEDVRRAATAALGENMVRLTVLPEEQLSTASTSLDRTAMPGASPSP
ncbi:MAG: insulinase family protein, partial [Chloroflexi bacterium]|nr:insulinase family protein [Chloroflexota bacterium]